MKEKESIFQINEKWRIKKLDSICMQLQELQQNEMPEVMKRKGYTESKARWVGVGYYADLHSALKGAVKLMQFDLIDGNTDIAEVMSRLDKLEKDIRGKI